MNRHTAQPTSTPLVDLIFIAAAATVAATALLWTGAAAPTYLATGHRPRGPLTCALAALTRPGHPATAWPAGSGVPGPMCRGRTTDAPISRPRSSCESPANDDLAVTFSHANLLGFKIVRCHRQIGTPPFHPRRRIPQCAFAAKAFRSTAPHLPESRVEFPRHSWKTQHDAGNMRKFITVQSVGFMSRGQKISVLPRPCWLQWT